MICHAEASPRVTLQQLAEQLPQATWPHRAKRSHPGWRPHLSRLSLSCPKLQHRRRLPGPLPRPSSRRAGEAGGTLPAVLNAANEAAVEAFVNGRINFPQISDLVRRTMERHQVVSHPTLEQILAADAWARREAAV